MSDQPNAFRDAIAANLFPSWTGWAPKNDPSDLDRDMASNVLAMPEMQAIRRGLAVLTLRERRALLPPNVAQWVESQVPT